MNLSRFQDFKIYLQLESMDLESEFQIWYKYILLPKNDPVLKEYVGESLEFCVRLCIWLERPLCSVHFLSLGGK